MAPILAGEEFSVFYVNLCEYFNQNLKEVDEFLLGLTEERISMFSKMLDEFDDLLLFFDDLSAVQDKKLTAILGTVIYQYTILPAVVGSMRLKEKGFVSINLAIYIFIRMFALL